MMKIEQWMSKTPQMDYIEFQMDEHKNDQIEKLSWYTRAHYFFVTHQNNHIYAKVELDECASDRRCYRLKNMFELFI